MSVASNHNKLPEPAQMAVILTGIAGLAAGMYSLVIAPPPLAPSLLWVLIGALAANVKVPLGKGSSLSILTAVVLICLMQNGAGAATLVAVCGVAVQTIFPSAKNLRERLVFNIGMISLAVLITSMVYNSSGLQYFAIVLAGLVYGVVNAAFIALIVALTRKQSIVPLWWAMFKPSAPSFALGAFVSLAAVQILANAGTNEMLVVLLMLFITYHSSVRLASSATAR